MRLTGPGLSLGASGTIAKTLVFSIWKGQAYGRVRVIPKNFRTDAQQTTRSVLGTIAKAARAVLTKFKDAADPQVGSQFFLDGNASAPSGQSWLSWMQQVIYGLFATLRSAYLAGPEADGFYDSNAAELGMNDYVDKMGVTQTAGFQLYILAAFAAGSLGYDGFVAGIDEATDAQLTTFKTYVQTTVA
jgi:hypothetical protein